MANALTAVINGLSLASRLRKKVDFLSTYAMLLIASLLENSTHKAGLYHQPIFEQKTCEKLQMYADICFTSPPYFRGI